MSSSLRQAFNNANKNKRPALLTYTVAGDNNIKKSIEILKSISKYADICEIGFPIIHQSQMVDKFRLVHIEQLKMV